MHAHRFAFPDEHTRVRGYTGCFESRERVVPLILLITEETFPSIPSTILFQDFYYSSSDNQVCSSSFLLLGDLILWQGGDCAHNFVRGEKRMVGEILNGGRIDEFSGHAVCTVHFHIRI